MRKATLRKPANGQELVRQLILGPPGPDGDEVGRGICNEFEEPIDHASQANYGEVNVFRSFWISAIVTGILCGSRKSKGSTVR